MSRESEARSARGFTLVELIIAMALAVILLTAGVPSLRTAILDGQLVADVNEFVTALHMTRAEAIRRGHRVTLCKSPDGASCTNAGDWSQGWIVFIDPDRDGLDGPDDILQAHGPLGADNTLKGNTNVANSISYVGTGAPTAGQSAQIGTIALCDSRGATHGRAVAISLTGRPYVEEATTCTP